MQRLWILCAIALLSLLVAGCGVLTEESPESDVSGGDEDAARDDEGGDSEISGDQEEASVLLHMPNDTGLWLEEKRHAVAVRDHETEAETALRAWMESADFLPAVEAEVSRQGDKADISFTSAIKDMEVEYEGLIVQSLVNSLTAVDGVASVQILVDGEETHTLAGRSYIGEPLQRDESLLAREGYRPIAPADPRRGETFLEGIVRSVDADSGTLEVEVIQEKGEGGTARFGLADDVVLHQQIIVDGAEKNEEIDCEDVSAGDAVAMILRADDTARAVIVLE